MKSKSIALGLFGLVALGLLLLAAAAQFFQPSPAAHIPPEPAEAAASDTASSAPAGFFAANWNVENLFDTADDPRNRKDNEFLPRNPDTRWTRKRFETKLENLAEVITHMNGGAGPDLLGLEEIENRSVLESLVQKLPGQSYGIVHEDSPDPRGIDTALLYNRALFELVDSRTHRVNLRWHRDTRDILQADFRGPDGRLLHVFVNHWPSRGSGTKQSDPERFTAARTLSRALRPIFQNNPDAHVLILGDFNDEPSSRSVRVVLDVKPYSSRTDIRPDRLYNLTAAKSAQGWGTYFHSFNGRNEFRMYDQIIASGALLRGARIEYQDDSLWIVQPDFMTESRGWRKGAPVSTYRDRDRYQGGYSDHFPIGARFVFIQPSAPDGESQAPEAPAAEADAPVLW